MTASPRARAALAALALAVATAAVYAPALRLGTVEYDDPDYVTRNPHVQAGLTWEGLRWAATSTFAANWFPLTWASHMLDHELWGDDLAGHHATSVALHVVNTLLLFALLARATGRVARAAVVAALFALHPLHVESVAWLSERKDVLSAAFGLAAANAHVAYARRPGAARLALVAALFACSLAAKPMLVTLPALLVLLDAWPLGRVDAAALADRARAPLERLRASGALRVVVEKLPLLALAAASSAVTMIVQRQAVVPLELFPLDKRLASVPLAYATYLGQTLWPVDLVPSHLHPGRAVSVAFGAAVGLGLVGATAVLARSARSAPHRIVGWLWFLGTLVPVIGFVQVGNQFVADRYTYVPIVGLFLAATWEAAERLGGTPRGRAAAAALAGVALVACSAVTRAQIPYWNDTVTLFARNVAVDPSNHIAHSILGLGYARLREEELAIHHYERAAQLRPYHHLLLFRISKRLVDQGDVDLAIDALERELRIAPDFAPARRRLTVLRDRRDDLERLLSDVGSAGGEGVETPGILAHLGFMRLALVDRDGAARSFEAALAADPDHVLALRGLAVVRLQEGDRAGALALAERAAAIAPGSPEVERLLAALRAGDDAAATDVGSDREAGADGVPPAPGAARAPDRGAAGDAR
ncbi:MAG: tetratricopeptide repeat protein [Myxococcota bacterium]